RDGASRATRRTDRRTRADRGEARRARLARAVSLPACGAAARFAALGLARVRVSPEVDRGVPDARGVRGDHGGSGLARRRGRAADVRRVHAIRRDSEGGVVTRRHAEELASRDEPPLPLRARTTTLAAASRT